MENAVTQIEVLGRKIHECRGGSGRPLVYLHSAGGEAIWLPYLTGLAERCELPAPAHPGFLNLRTGHPVPRAAPAATLL